MNFFKLAQLAKITIPAVFIGVIVYVFILPGRSNVLVARPSNQLDSFNATEINPGEMKKGASIPVVVNLKDIPPGVYDPNNQYDRWRRGEIQLERGDSIIDRLKQEDLKVEAYQLSPSEAVQHAIQAPTSVITGFDSLDFTECCGGSGGTVPPDPELAVGPNHIIAVVNVAFEIYDKNGISLQGPTTFSSFMESNNHCIGVFDPNAIYDESADRFILGIDADGASYCLAISQTGDPMGLWNIYAFDTGPDFFDYPQAGVGRDAIYMGGNIFSCHIIFGCAFVEARIWAFDKTAMYAGLEANYVSLGLPDSEDTPQPLHLHGWAQQTWPTHGPHYFLSDTNYNGDTYSVFSWSEPFGTNTLTLVGVLDLTAWTGVNAGIPIDVPQSGGQEIQGNDFRPQDFEYRNGYGWSTMTIACNPGAGTVNCVRWAKINLSAAAVVDAGVYASDGEYRIFSDMAVDACDNMMLGYTKSSSSTYPGIWVAGRLASDAAGTLRPETELKAGEISYTSFESAPPRRWGDYTGMTIDPNGTTFWYLGEYSKDTATTNGRWGTYIGALTYDCTPVPPTSSIYLPLLVNGEDLK